MKTKTNITLNLGNFLRFVKECSPKKCTNPTLMLRVTGLFITIMCFLNANSQNITIHLSSKVSKYFNDWTKYNQLYISTSFSDTVIGVFELAIFDNMGVEALSTKNATRMYQSGPEIDSQYIFTILPGDTLNLEQLNIAQRAMLDSTYGEYFMNNFCFPPGNYILKLYLYDTSKSVIFDSTTVNLNIESYSIANNLYPFDNSQICFSKLDSLFFTFGNFDPVTIKEIQITQIDTIANLFTDLEFDFINGTYPVHKASVSNLDLQNGFTFRQKFPHLHLNTETYYAYTIRSFVGEGALTPIKANAGYSTPYFFKLKTDDDCPFNVDLSFCEEIEDGFEGGPFVGSALSKWVCRTGERTASKFFYPNYITMNNVGQRANRHQVVPRTIDPYGLETVHPNGGQYAVKLGNDQVGSEAEQISRTFTVTQANAQFALAYAVVLDPAHVGDNNSLLRIRIFRTRSVGFWQDVIKREIIYADPSDGFLRKSGNYLIGDWRCYSVDLSPLVGESVTIEITTADCRQGAHFGYAYIDFCVDIVPQFVLDLDPEYCEGEVINASGYKSVNFTSYLFTIEECLDMQGTRFGAPEIHSQWSRDHTIPTTNLTQLYNSKGFKFECDKFYRIKLAGNNECHAWVETVKVIRIKCPNVTSAAGPDRCCLFVPCQLQLGSTPIPNYSYSWSPANGLSSATIANPIFSRNEISTSPLKYVVTVNDGQCELTDEVEVFFGMPEMRGYSYENYECFQTYQVSAINYSSISWSYIDDKGVTHIGSGSRIPLIPASPTKEIVVIVKASNICGEVTDSIRIPKRSSIYFGKFPTIIYPNVMQANHNKKSLAFFEVGIPKDQRPAYNALGYRLIVFNRWGQKIFEDTEMWGGNFANGQINWNGKIDGTNKFAHTGTFHHSLELINCESRTFTKNFDKRRFECVGTARKWLLECFC